ncbi:hypothetical protein [Aureimonas jatrophae]|uniref:Uncharacterized protein n=1 Tax=Aureimonas jatrophae TaxID=1166073 RepID=A0A1H0M627_9HYPH|nr:hypothetical protein [Aureimonas jatrophae]MBB3952606.1 uncharacterized protein YidB (DUF937 family) [Aureimonas jatrophae]SDO75883.1 hypothetical protein SAMN05192530_11285 [Aureimonas jatrophae]
MTKRKTDGAGEGGSSANFKPFADDEAAVTIGGMTIENGTDHVSISGSLDIAADKAGLEQAKALKEAVDAIVSALTAKGDLPEKAEAEEVKPTKKARNPFG